jgi:hypothetical protein
LLDCSHSFEQGNENKEAWTKLDEETIVSIPAWDCKEQVDATDGFKGRPEAFDETVKRASLFLDSKHRSDAIAVLPVSRGGGKVGKAWYQKALNAATPRKLKKNKNEMPTAVAEHLGKTPDSEQYPAAASGELRGKTTSSYVESGNKSVLPVRHLHPAAALVSLAEKMKERFEANRAAASACPSFLPPRLMESLKKVKEQAARIAPGDIRFTNPDKTKGTTPLLGKPKKVASVDLSKMHMVDKGACDQSCSVLTGFPCCHQIAFADAGEHDIKDFIHEIDTADGWRSQYENVQFELPSEADYDDQSDLWDSSICLVPPYKRGRGRPSKKRKLGFLEKLRKKSKPNVTCQRCWGAGHTKRSAKCPLRVV